MTDEPTLVIQGRVAPDKLALALKFIVKQGHVPRSRSDLVAMAFQVCCELAQMQGIEKPTTNHEAFETMLRYGIEWPVGAHRKDIVKSLAWDSMGEMSMEELLERHGQVEQLRRIEQGTTGTEDGEEGGIDWDQVEAELEALDKELRGGDDGK